METHAIPDTLHCCPICQSDVASGVDENGQLTVCEQCARHRGQGGLSNRPWFVKALFIGVLIGLGGIAAVMLVWLIK